MRLALTHPDKGSPPRVGEVEDIAGALYVWADGFLFQAHRELTPEESAAHLLGAPAESFVSKPAATPAA